MIIVHRKDEFEAIRQTRNESVRHSPDWCTKSMKYWSFARLFVPEHAQLPELKTGHAELSFYCGFPAYKNLLEASGVTLRLEVLGQRD